MTDLPLERDNFKLKWSKNVHKYLNDNNFTITMGSDYYE